VTFIFSEFRAGVDAHIGRMQNMETRKLEAQGHTELGIMMDWGKSNAVNMVLYNWTDEKGRLLYTPTIQHMGFQRTDSALMSFDTFHAETETKIPKDYDRVRDGVELEIVQSSQPEKPQSALMVRVTSPPKHALMEGMVYRLDRLESRHQMGRMLEALRTVLAQPQDSPDGKVSTLQPHPVLQDLILVPPATTLSQAGKEHVPLTLMDFGGNPQKEADLQTFQDEAHAIYSRILNDSQIEALKMALARHVTLIQGPPGTGKTTTAVQIVLAFLKYNLVELPMLVTADSNTAVDNLVKGIGKEGVKVIRVGRSESIRADVKQYSLDKQFKELKHAQVICATCIGVSGGTLDRMRFGTVLVDECTQAAESAALVPIARGCQQVILIGDQCQLPPTVLSDVAETQNLGESLFTRLVTQGVRPVLLDTQYRMNPFLCEFASAAFYNGRLQNGVSHLHRKPPKGFPWPQQQMPVAFFNVERAEEKREGASYINIVEAEKVIWALQEVCRSGEIEPDTVGIVTPYKGQVNYIKGVIKSRPSLEKFRYGLEVESVDGFQGQEKEVIIFCSVRNNKEHKVGFLSDWRRLNVMLTRARRGNIIIGSKSILNSDPLWQQWLLWASCRGAIHGEPARGTWTPKYLVDDRDGMWKVKEDIVKAPAVVKASHKEAAPAPIKEEPEEIADCWEDMLSPAATPTNQAQAVADDDELEVGGFSLDADAKPAAAAPAAAAAPEAKAAKTEMPAESVGKDGKKKPAKELRRPVEAEGMGLSATPAAPARPYRAPDDGIAEAAALGLLNSPPASKEPPMSPARQMALERMGFD
jgi:hypothetical protein